jgi:xanthine permease XanP
MSGEQRIAPVRKKPASLPFGVDEHPPWHVTLLAAIQHFAVLIYSAFPLVIVARAAGATNEQAISMVSAGLLVIAVGTLAHIHRIGPFGSGYLLPNGFHIGYFGPYLAAAALGGLPLVFGMTVFLGLLEACFSQLLYRLRSILPSEISGLVILLTGVLVADIGLRFLFGKANLSPEGGIVASITLAAMIMFHVWGRGLVRLMSVLLGMLVGYAVALYFLPDTILALARATDTPLLAVPSFGHVSWSFDWSMAPPFAVLALSAAMGTSGNVTVQQRLNDADWKRPDLGSIVGGIFTAGLIKAMSGLTGTTAIGNLSANVGVTVASGVASRDVAYAIATIAGVLAFLPLFSAALMTMPEPVVASAMLFVGSTLLVSGIQIITSRLLDARRTLVIGLSIAAALATLAYPAIKTGGPIWLQPLTSSLLVVGTAVGILLTALFRLGVRKKVVLSLELGEEYASKTYDFMMLNGAAWGARPEVIHRAAFGAEQLVETLLESGVVEGPVEITAAFDEFNLDLTATYKGAAFDVPEQRPSDEEIMEAEDGARRLAGFMLRRNADRVEATRQNGGSRIRLHFDH